MDRKVKYFDLSSLGSGREGLGKIFDVEEFWGEGKCGVDDIDAISFKFEDWAGCCEISDLEWSEFEKAVLKIIVPNLLSKRAKNRYKKFYLAAYRKEAPVYYLLTF